ncbi:protein Diedel-like [Leptopilina boulardi]|uniref:protein Diedel-like n=1 Tax=Leptopilina boulardi TaxID=63433 RepID=UPI0021F5982C|nr:protein Diedel-like [Leptopilina boulardi]
MFKFCSLLLLVTLSSFPHLSHADCCKKTRLYFYSGNYACTDFPGAEQKASRLVNLQYWITYGKSCHIDVCGDGTPVTEGTYCGKGACNIFGCNCDGGCIQGNPLESFQKLNDGKISNLRDVE